MAVAAGVSRGGAPRLFGVPLPALKGAVFVLGLLPLARWVVLGLTGGLGVNPQEFLTRSAGVWTFVCLLVTLGITPLRLVTGQPLVVRLRRMCGLFAFFYASLHFLAYVWWDQWFDVAAILADVARRPFIAFGFAAFVLLLALALTSTQGWMRRLGRNWSRLHRAVYAAAVLALVHLWLHKAGKNDFYEVWLYGGVLAVLLAVRVARRLRARN